MVFHENLTSKFDRTGTKQKIRKIFTLVETERASYKMPPDFIDISPEQNGGIFKKIIKEGVGDEKPTLGCKVEVNVKIDDKDEEIARFNLGTGEIVQGCEIAISSMRKGEKATFICTPQYANILPSVSETSTVEFHIELLNWDYEDLSSQEDGGIRRIILTPGEGTETPNEGAKVEIHAIGKFQDEVFEDRTVSFCIGEGLEYDLVEGIDIALLKFKKGEKSRLLLKSPYAFKDTGFEKYGIPPNADVEYEVTLLSFTRVKDIWEMNDDEKIEEASRLKEKGNIFFQRGNLQLASSMYRRVIDMLKLFEDGRHIKEEDPKCESIFFSAHMNLSLCCLKLENYQEAKHSVLVALRLRPDDEKAHFRTGKVFFALGEYRSAIDSFQECLEINPNNKAALAEIKLSSNAVKEHIKQERKIYGQMFDRFAEEDSQREKSEMRKICNVMSSVGEWGAEDREREPSEFEKENPDILLLNKTGEFKDM